MNMPSKRPSYNYAKHQLRNLENTEPATVEDYIKRIMGSTQYLTENEYINEFLLHHQESNKEIQGSDYIKSLLSPVLREIGKYPSIDTFKKIWEKIKDRKQQMDCQLADVNRDIEASYKLVQHKFRERPDILQDLHIEYQKVYQENLDYRIQDKVQDAKNYDDLITVVNQYLDLSTTIQEVEAKVLGKLNQREDDLRDEVKDPKYTKYLTFEQKRQLSDTTNSVSIKEMRNDIYERKQQMDNALTIIHDRIQTPKQWLAKTFKKRSDIPQELQNECRIAYQQALKEENKLQTLIEQAKLYDDLEYYMGQSETLFDAIATLEQAQIKVLLCTDKKWALDVKQKEDMLAKLINTSISRKLEQLQQIVDKGQSKGDHAFNRDFTNACHKAFEDVLPRSEKELRLAYTIEKRKSDEFDPLTPRNMSLKMLNQVIRELQQLDTDLDKLLKLKVQTDATHPKEI
jgi:hypothetical protein